MAEQGLLCNLRGPWHRRDMQVRAHWPTPYEALASSADTREMAGGMGGLGWLELPSPSHEQPPAPRNAPSCLLQSHFSRPGDRLL